MNNEIEFLKKSLLYQMSLGSKELYHSNVWAWLMEMDNNFINAFFYEFDASLYSSIKIFREKHNRDILIYLDTKDSSARKNTILVIENKIKTLPEKSQLEKYSEDLDGYKFSKAVFTGLINPLDDIVKITRNGRVFEWVFESYESIAQKIKNIALKSNSEEIKNNLSKVLEYVEIIECMSKILKEKLYNAKDVLSYCYNDEGLNSIRLHSLYLMLKGADFLDYIKKRKSQIPLPNKNLYLDIHQSFNNGKATIDVRYSNKTENSTEWLVLGVQIEGYQYRLIAEKNKSAHSSEEIYQEFEKNWFNTRELSKRMRKKYCQYVKDYCFVYQYNDINDTNNKYETIFSNIVEDLTRATKILNETPYLEDKKDFKIEETSILNEQSINNTTSLCEKQSVNKEKEQKSMNAQQAQDNFWSFFDDYLQKQGNPFTICHVKGGKNQNAGNINTDNPMAIKTICCEFKYMEQVVLVQVYLKDNVRLYDYLYSKKNQLEEDLGFSLEWINRGKRSLNVRRMQRTFYIEDFSSYASLIQEVFPYILSFIRVFSKYL